MSMKDIGEKMYEQDEGDIKKATGNKFGKAIGTNWITSKVLEYEAETVIAHM